MSVDNELCLKLLKANFDHEVKEILTEAGYWTTKQVWRPVGDKLDNHGIINNQQVEPVDAFVEKLTNSIDAVLISECLERGIDPTSRDAPETVKHAVAKFIEGKDADPQNLKATDGLQGHWAERGMDVTGVSRRVTVVATGYTPKENNGKGCPTISVIDDGEGQTPKKFPETLLKLGSSNKQKVLFAQGKWGQGGTGVLPFCSEQNHFQIIISKRNPKLLDLNANISDNNWGFTVVRKRELNEEEREEMPTWEYLAPTPSDGQYGDVLECDLATLPIKPIETGAKRAFNQEANHGTVVKLIEYQYKSSCSTGNLLLRSGMRAALDTCFPEPPLPYRIFDERYEAHTPADTTQGLIYRLEKDKQESIEEGFPSTYDMTILNENVVSAKVYVFKSGKPKHVQRYNRDTYINKAGVIFTVNGQTHHTIDTGFFSTRGIKYGHIKDTMAVIVDCSKLSRKTLSDLFTSSRDQIRKNDFYIALIDQLAESIKNDRLLRDVNMRRGQENLRRDLDSSKTIDDILKDLLKKNKSLAEFLKLGGRVSAPFREGVGGGGDNPTFNSQNPPTFFRLKANNEQKHSRIHEVGKKARIQFVTDAPNNYFNRSFNPAKRKVNQINSNGEDILLSGSWGSLHDGAVEYIITSPSSHDQDKSYTMEFIIEDEALLQPFICEVGLEIIASKGPSPKGGKPNPGKQSKLAIPPISDGTHLQGEEGYQEGWTKETALIYVHDEDNPQFIYNRDNVHLQRDQKNLLERIDPKICERRFSIGLAFVCLSIADGLEDLNKRNNNENTYDIEETIKDIAQSIAPVINPIIDSLSNAALQEAGEDE